MKKEKHRKFWVIFLTVIAFLILSVGAHVTTVTVPATVPAIVPVEDIVIEDPIELEAWMTKPLIIITS